MGRLILGKMEDAPDDGNSADREPDDEFPDLPPELDRRPASAPDEPIEPEIAARSCRDAHPRHRTSRRREG